MKKLNFFLTAVATAVVAMAVTSCSKLDNPATPSDTQNEEKEEVTEGKLIIKEISVGSVQGYNWCKAIVLYNNGGTAVTLKNAGLGFAPPYNAYGPTSRQNYDDNGVLNYENADYVPALQAVWYFPEDITVEPYSDVVIAVNGAIDHTQATDKEGVFNLANADYFAMYDPDGGFTNASAYPAPFEGIPANHYLKSVLYGAGNAWAISMLCPALILFQTPDNVNLKTYSTEADNLYYTGGKEIAANACIKIKNEWILDGVELFKTTEVEASSKRLPAKVDAGFGLYLNLKGYSAYRNVDQEATEAIKDNADKLVYGYDQAVEGTTEPSGIDAAASAKNGAKIVFKDTNNSSDDFHLRAGWSLK